MNSKFLLGTALLFAAATGEPEGGGAAAEAKPEKPKREKQNGVTRPSPGTNTGKVWEIADSISEKNQRPAKRAEVVEAGTKAGLNPSTVTTQFGQWRRFYGIAKEAKPAATETADKPKKGKGKKSSNPNTEEEQAANDAAAKARAEAATKAAADAEAEEDAAEAAVED